MSESIPINSIEGSETFDDLDSYSRSRSRSRSQSRMCPYCKCAHCNCRRGKKLRALRRKMCRKMCPHRKCNCGMLVKIMLGLILAYIIYVGYQNMDKIRATLKV
jgi:hypothetical protein